MSENQKNQLVKSITYTAGDKIFTLTLKDLTRKEPSKVVMQEEKICCPCIGCGELLMPFEEFKYRCHVCGEISTIRNITTFMCHECRFAPNLYKCLSCELEYSVLAFLGRSEELPWVAGPDDFIKFGAKLAEAECYVAAQNYFLKAIQRAEKIEKIKPTLVLIRQKVFSYLNLTVAEFMEFGNLPPEHLPTDSLEKLNKWYEECHRCYDPQILTLAGGDRIKEMLPISYQEFDDVKEELRRRGVLYKM